MRKLIYSIGVTLFLAFLAFHVTTSLTNPYFGVSVEALAQGSGSGGSGGIDECPGGVVGSIDLMVHLNVMHVVRKEKI